MPERIRMLTSQFGSHDASAPTRLYEAGEEHVVGTALMPSGLAAVFLREGWAEGIAGDPKITNPKQGQTEQKVTTPPENKAVGDGPPDSGDESVDVSQYHAGGGYYNLPSGEQVRGKEAARRALAKS